MCRADEPFNAGRVTTTLDSLGVRNLPMSASETSLVDTLVRRLCDQYEVDAALVHEYAAGVVAGFRGVRLQVFVPLLVEKQVRDILRRHHVRRDRSPQMPT